MIVAVSLLLGQIYFGLQPVKTGYRPPFLPKFLAKAKPIKAYVGESAVRSYSPVWTVWEVDENIDRLSKALSADKEIQRLRKPRQRNRHFYELELKDRTISIRLDAGRNILKRKNGVSWEVAKDREKYTTIRIQERALPVGLLPKPWPKESINSAKLPNKFRGLGLTGVPVEPTFWNPMLTPVGAVQYGMRWYVKGDPKKLIPMFRKELSPFNSGGGDLRHPVYTRVGYPKQGSHTRFLSIDFEEGPPGNQKWTIINASWIDAKDSVFDKVANRGFYKPIR